MSEFKSKILVLVCVLISIFFACFIIYQKEKKRIEAETYYPHALSIYTAEGDTVLDLDTEASSVKIWIEENGEPDVWISNENGGWTRK